MGKGHGRSIELNMDYRGDMARGNVLCRSNVELIESRGMWYTTAIVLLNALKNLGKNRPFALTFACHGEKTIAPRGA